MRWNCFFWIEISIQSLSNLQCLPTNVGYLVLLQSILGNIHQVCNTSTTTVLHHNLRRRRKTVTVSDFALPKLQNKKPTIALSFSNFTINQSKCYPLPKDTLLLGSSPDTEQHQGDCIAAASQFHHKFLHTPPPKNKSKSNSEQSNQSNA